MLFNFALVFSFLFVSAVLADRGRERHSQFSDRVKRPTNASSDVNNQYNGNWAGAVWQQGDGTFNYITGTFNVPTPSGQSGSGASVWVGIDGDTCTSAILQAGIYFTITDSGDIAYDAWYEWYPDYAYVFVGFTMSAGDVIKVTVTTSSATSGSIQIENQSNGEIASQQVSSSYPLCGQNAEWIVEDFIDSGTLVPFAYFDPVTFWDAVAAGGAGTYTPDGAILMDIDQNNGLLTNTVAYGSSVNIQHT